MDYYQGVVVEYLRADRRLFVNTECLIQLNPGPNPDTSGPHWYCDAITVDVGNEAVFLCEVSYAQGLASLLKRLADWSGHWEGVCAAISRDCRVPNGWPVRSWIFIPTDGIGTAVRGIRAIEKTNGRVMPPPRITPLEMVTPWQYKSWDRDGEKMELKPDTIPPEMKI